MPNLRTEHLTLIPAGLEVIEAAIAGKDALAGLIGYHVPGSWPQPDYADVLPYIAERLRADPTGMPWGSIIVHTGDACVIGDVGCLEGPDSEGTVEIGYSIVPEYRGHGYATEAGKALVEWALQQPGVERIVAECATDNAASVRVLEKIGLKQTGSSGEALRWEVHKAPRQ